MLPSSDCTFRKKPVTHTHHNQELEPYMTRLPLEYLGVTESLTSSVSAFVPS